MASMLAVCLGTDIRIDAEQVVRARRDAAGKFLKYKEKGRAFLRPGLFLSQDPRIRADSAQRCLKKATEKSATGESPGGKLRARRNGAPQQGRNCGCSRCHNEPSRRLSKHR
jgi:hypothetical protein